MECVAGASSGLERILCSILGRYVVYGGTGTKAVDGGGTPQLPYRRARTGDDQSGDGARHSTPFFPQPRDVGRVQPNLLLQPHQHPARALPVTARLGLVRLRRTGLSGPALEFRISLPHLLHPASYRLRLPGLHRDQLLDLVLLPRLQTRSPADRVVWLRDCRRAVPAGAEHRRVHPPGARTAVVGTRHYQTRSC